MPGVLVRDTQRNGALPGRDLDMDLPGPAPVDVGLVGAKPTNRRIMGVFRSGRSSVCLGICGFCPSKEVVGGSGGNDTSGGGLVCAVHT